MENESTAQSAAPELVGVGSKELLAVVEAATDIIVGTFWCDNGKKMDALYDTLSDAGLVHTNGSGIIVRTANAKLSCGIDAVNSSAGLS